MTQNMKRFDLTVITKHTKKSHCGFQRSYKFVCILSHGENQIKIEIYKGKEEANTDVSNTNSATYYYFFITRVVVIIIIMVVMLWPRGSGHTLLYRIFWKVLNCIYKSMHAAKIISKLTHVLNTMIGLFGFKKTVRTF